MIAQLGLPSQTTCPLQAQKSEKTKNAMSDGHTDGGACCHSLCSKQLWGRRLAARGQLPRPQAPPMPGPLSACSTARGELTPAAGRRLQHRNP